MAHPAVILTEGDVENRVQGVLDAPVPADGSGQGGRIVVATGEKVADLGLDPGFTHEVFKVERYACFSNCKSLSALSGAAISKPRRVIAERAQLPERSD